MQVLKKGAIHMPNKACKTAPNLKNYLIPPHLRLPQSHKAISSLQVQSIYSLLLSPFCGTILVEKVPFNKCVTSVLLSVISCKIPLFSYDFFTFLPFQFCKKSPPIYLSGRDLTTLYIIWSSFHLHESSNYVAK